MYIMDDIFLANSVNPKMSLQDAANFLGENVERLQNNLYEHNLSFNVSNNISYFRYATARQLFRFNFDPMAIAFHVVKGGTGKTSLAFSFAVRANLYGLKVLCIDLDQQGNLTHSFGVDAEKYPVMIDILAEDYSYSDAIAEVYPGLDLLPSRIENALIDEVINIKNFDLKDIFIRDFADLKKHYDLIIVDCPPNLGKSITSVTIAVDKILAPIVPEKFSLAGLESSYTAISELEKAYNINIPLNIVLNKYDKRTMMSDKVLNSFKKSLKYKDKLLNTYIRTSQEFANVIANGKTLFDNVRKSTAVSDIDALTVELLGLKKIRNNYKNYFLSESESESKDYQFELE